VVGIRELLLTFLGPGRLWIVTRVDLNDGLHGTQVKELVRGIEAGMKHEYDNVYRVDVVVSGEAEPVGS
jgi:hypothetical protein